MSRLGPVGIDFGTTKTALAYKDVNGERKVISFPSVVSFADESNRVYNGETIGEIGRINPLTVWKNFKPYLCDDGSEWGKVPTLCHPLRLPQGITPPSVVHLTSLILRRIKLKYCEEKNESGTEQWDIGPTTLTVPAFSNFRQRQSLIYAARLAGFSDISLIEEPIAAYLYHYLNPTSKIKKEKLNTLVIDFGGGTCDLALIASDAKKDPDVLGTYTLKHGLKDLGGNDIDSEIINVWKTDGAFMSNLPQIGALPPQISNELVDSAKAAKESHNPRPGEATPALTNFDLISFPLLSERYVDKKNSRLREGEDIVYPGLGLGAFETILTNLHFASTLDSAINHLLHEQSLTREAIGQVVLAGGSCYIRRVLTTIRNAFPNLDPAKGEFLFDEPEFSIAMGAYEFQKKNNWLIPVIRNRLSMSIYLEIGFDPRIISKAWRSFTLGYSKLYQHDGKHFIELARRGSILRQISKIMYVPLPATSRRDHQFRIHQVKPSQGGEDYKQINEKSLIEEIKIPASSRLVTIKFWMDQSGDYRRSIKRTPNVSIPKFRNDVGDEWNWRDADSIKEKTWAYFQVKR